MEILQRINGADRRPIAKQKNRGAPWKPQEELLAHDGKCNKIYGDYWRFQIPTVIIVILQSRFDLGCM